MNARDKIKGLTNAWYGYTFCAAVLSLVTNGIGIFSIVTTAVSLVVSFLVIWFIGNRLLAKSSLMRGLMLVLSGIFSVLAGLGAAKAGWMFVHEWSLSLLTAMFFGAAGGYMQIRSFKTLVDSQVKAYFA